jgi:hypothetical protein
VGRRLGEVQRPIARRPMEAGKHRHDPRVRPPAVGRRDGERVRDLFEDQPVRVGKMTRPLQLRDRDASLTQAARNPLIKEGLRGLRARLQDDGGVGKLDAVDSPQAYAAESVGARWLAVRPPKVGSHRPRPVIDMMHGCTSLRSFSPSTSGIMICGGPSIRTTNCGISRCHVGANKSPR